MPHTSLPVYDSQKSTIAKPILLLEGRTWRIVDEEVITYRVDGGREIFAEQLASRSVRTDPQKKKILLKDGTEKEKTFYTLRTMKAAKRKSAPPQMCAGGESGRLTPGRPTNGNIGLRGYGLLLDRFAVGERKARNLFRSRRTSRNRGGVSRELQMETHKGSILFFPWEGISDQERRSNS